MKNLKSLEVLFVSLAAASAAIPGIALLRSGIQPPGENFTYFIALAELLAALTILYAIANKRKLLAMPIKKVNRLVRISLIAALGCLIGFLILREELVVKLPNESEMLYPLWTTGDLKSDLDSMTKRTIIQEYGFDEVRNMIYEMDNYSLAITTTNILLLLTYQGVFSLLTYCFTIYGLVVSNKQKTDISA